MHNACAWIGLFLQFINFRCTLRADFWMIHWCYAHTKYANYAINQQKSWVNQNPQCGKQQNHQFLRHPILVFICFDSRQSCRGWRVDGKLENATIASLGVIAVVGLRKINVWHSALQGSIKIHVYEPFQSPGCKRHRLLLMSSRILYALD